MRANTICLLLFLTHSLPAVGDSISFLFLGLAKAIGVSNYTIDHLKEMESYAEIMPAVNQVKIESVRRTE